MRQSSAARQSEGDGRLPADLSCNYSPLAACWSVGAWQACVWRAGGVYAGRVVRGAGVCVSCQEVHVTCVCFPMGREGRGCVHFLPGGVCV